MENGAIFFRVDICSILRGGFPGKLCEITNGNTEIACANSAIFVQNTEIFVQNTEIVNGSIEIVNENPAIFVKNTEVVGGNREIMNGNCLRAGGDGERAAAQKDMAPPAPQVWGEETIETGARFTAPCRNGETRPVQ